MIRMPPAPAFGRGHIWILIILAAVLFAVHGVAFYFASSHLALSAGLVSALIFVALIKHLGLLAPACVLFRRLIRKR